MQGLLPSLVTASKLKNILKFQSTFVKNFRLLEANVGEEMKETFLK
jgi:hypothetical protein